MTNPYKPPTQTDSASNSDVSDSIAVLKFAFVPMSLSALMGVSALAIGLLLLYRIYNSPDAVMEQLRLLLLVSSLVLCGLGFLNFWATPKWKRNPLLPLSIFLVTLAIAILGTKYIDERANSLPTTIRRLDSAFNVR